jgi:hypothetical protein
MILVQICTSVLVIPMSFSKLPEIFGSLITDIRVLGIIEDSTFIERHCTSSFALSIVKLGRMRPKSIDFFFMTL